MSLEFNISSNNGISIVSFKGKIVSDEHLVLLQKEISALNEPNATAFDRWRQALAAQGYPVWGVTPEKAAAIKARAEELKLEEAKRMAELPELLATLKKDAPLVTAAELMKQPKAKP